ncbi:MAG TPA: M48 family metalloprotease [Candidatus Acidoferrum sp.]|nr:M48 family metalloprotease [Candidatus Acidoferrum sp.]
MTKRIFSFVLAALFAFTGLRPADAAGQAPVFIRDAEIEAIIAGYTAPIFTAAGLDPSAVRVYIVKDDTINAFVAGGMNIFVFTGLLLRAERPAQLIGVIAHETGHIAGGHLARRNDALRAATIEAIVACILGVGAAAGSGQGGAAGACQLGQQIGMMSLLAFTRTQEASADQAGMSFLDATHQSARGLLEFFKILGKQESLLIGQQDPYLRTHPLTQDRIEAVTAHIAHSPYSDVPDRPEFVAGFKRIQAKLRGYTEPLARVLQRYPESDKSLEARYARSVAYAQPGQANLPKAIALADSLIADAPEDPYFQENKAEILLKSANQAKAALPYYEAAVTALPDSPLILTELAMAQLAIGDPALVKKAIPELEKVVRIEPRSGSAWRQLCIAYGTDGQVAMASLACAEEASTGSTKRACRQAKEQAQRAMQGLPEGSPAWLRAQDIYNGARCDEIDQ